MRSDSRQFLYDIATAAKAIREFSHGRTLPDYENDLMLRSACERQFEIIGEAMTRLRGANTPDERLGLLGDLVARESPETDGA